MAPDAQWSAVARGYRFALIFAVAAGFLSIAACAALGHWLAGLFICVGLGLGGWNSRRLWTDTQKLTDTTRSASGAEQVDAVQQPGLQWRGPAVGASARRLGLITVLGFLIALAYRPLGWTVFLGLVLFQILMVATVGPALRRLLSPKLSGNPVVHP